MNESQRQNLLKHLGRMLAQAVSDEEFTALDDVRSALKKWDLQGAIPHEAELRAWGIDPEAPLVMDEEVPPVAAPASVVVPDEAEVAQILQTLRERIAANAPDADAQRVVRKELLAWRDAGRPAPLPYAEELAAWGIWPPAPPAAQATPPVSEPPPTAFDPDAALLSDYETARSLIAAQPYQAIQRLEALQARAQGGLVERLAADLSEARVELQCRTEALVIAAQRVQQQYPKDLTAQSEAWRAVTTLNRESLVAQQALQKLQQRTREALESEIKALEHDAREAAKRDDLPALNAARGAAEALAARTDLPDDLTEPVQALVTTVLNLLSGTRGRLGVASTLQVEGDLRESYRLARESFDKGIPMLVDTGGVLGPADAEVKTLDFFKVVSASFLEATRKKVDERLSSARAIQRGAPDAALARLEEARAWLTDEVWTPDHRQKLRPQLETVEQEIKEIESLLKRFQKAQEVVLQARADGVAARERLRLLNAAQQSYPDYPGIKEYLEDARDNLAGELAGVVAAQIVEAQRLTLQEQFPEALGKLQQARAEALRDVPAPKEGSALALALARVAQEEAAVAVAEQALRDLKKLLEQVVSKLEDYKQDKTNLLPLNEARALLDQVPEAQQRHPRVQDVRSRVAMEQGEAENYSAGKSAYARRDWSGAQEYFSKVTSAFAQYNEAQQLSWRAQAALVAEEAQKAELDKRWGDALKLYIQALYLFGEAGGADDLTGSLAAACREAKQRIEENDQRFRLPLEQAQKALTQAQKSTPDPKAPLPNRLDPIAEFKTIIDALTPLIETPSALSEDIKTTLRLAREAWRQAYLPALKEAVGNATLSEGLLEAARKRAAELKAAGLLYSTDEETLYYQLEGKLLDQAYARLYAAEVQDWAALERNRRARLDLPVVEKSAEHQAQWSEAHQKRLENEIRLLREQQGVAAAQKFLGEQIRVGKLRAEQRWLRLWLELCWEARDWEEADQVAQRLGEIAPDPQARRVQATLWRGLTRAARAYAEDDMEGARSQMEAVRQQVSDSVVNDVEAQLEEQTLQRLLNTAEQARRALEKSGSAATPEQYFTVARAYGLALQLSPDHAVAKQGLSAMSSRIEPVLRNRCQEAEALRILKQDLTAACAAAGQLLDDLKALQAIVTHLTLSTEDQNALARALAIQQKKKERWDRAVIQLKQFEEAVQEALTCPDAPRLDDLDNSGGWDFSTAQAMLKPLQVEAKKEQDQGLRELLEAEQRRLEGYEESARRVMQRVRALLQAIVAEQFETVTTAVKSLELLWKQVTGPDGAAWDGLDIVIRYLYGYPTREIHTLREHYEQALKQQANLNAWQQYEKDISGLYEALLTLEKELLDDEFDMLKASVALRDILAQCVTWEQKCEDFLKKLEQRAPQEPPLSARAAVVQANAAVEARRAHLNSEGGARARIAALKVAVQAEQAVFEPLLNRFRNFYNGLPPKVKDKRQSPRPEESDLARKLYQECKAHDPMNAELKRLRKQLEVLRIEF